MKKLLGLALFCVATTLMAAKGMESGKIINISLPERSIKIDNTQYLLSDSLKISAGSEEHINASKLKSGQQIDFLAVPQQSEGKSGGILSVITEIVVKDKVDGPAVKKKK